MSKRSGKFALGAIIAAVTGYATGILTAPKSGKETRKDIQHAAVKARTEAEKRLKKAHTELQRLIELGQKRADEASAKTKQSIQEALDQGRNVKDKARDLLTAIHEGDSSDGDLQQAIEDAEKAIEHLKKYVTKDSSSGKTTKK